MFTYEYEMYEECTGEKAKCVGYITDGHVLITDVDDGEVILIPIEEIDRIYYEIKKEIL
jgi:hypothetical protein